MRRPKSVLLDIGCGANKQGKDWFGLDKRKLPGVDLVHDLEVFPYPLPSGHFKTVIASHVLEHIKPWCHLDMWNEIWRITQVGGQLVVAAPYGVSAGFIQDPTHCKPINENYFFYFDPRPEAMDWMEVKDKKTGLWRVRKEGNYNVLYGIYKPKPWKISSWGWNHVGNIEAIMEKRPED